MANIKIVYKGVTYDYDALGEKEKEIMKEEIKKQFPEPAKEEKKEVKKKTSDE